MKIIKSIRVTMGTVAGVVAVIVLASACCSSGYLRLERVSDFLYGVFEVTFELDIDGYYSSSFNGDVGGWGYIPAFDGGRVEADLSAASFSGNYIDYDVDWDASDESLALLLAEDMGAGEPDILFMRWRGDAYTVDKKVCYVGWSDDDHVRLAASYCGDDVGVMYCWANRGSTRGPATCERCYTGEPCAQCDMGKSLGKCLPKSSTGGSVDLDIDIDIDIDIDMDVDRDDAPELDAHASGWGW